jgi:hypothetical protein
MVAMVKLLQGTTTVVENLSLAMAMSTMEKVLLAIVMPAMEAKVLLGVTVVATPVTHLLPLEVIATKVVARRTVSLSVRTHSSPHPKCWEAILLIITGSWIRRTRRS